MIPTSNNILGALSKKFITRWSVGAGEIIYLPLISSGSYNMLVDWGDGYINTITDYANNMHTYTNAGTYDIKITGTCTHWRMGDVGTSKDKIIAVLNWGDIGLLTMYRAFIGCSNLIKLAPFAPNTASYINAFYSTGVTELHELLLKNCVSTTNFSHCFQNGVFTSIPAKLFKNCVSATNYYAAFYSCLSLTGNAPELWNLDPAPSGALCFCNDTGLTNYAVIPANWK